MHMYIVKVKPSGMHMLRHIKIIQVIWPKHLVDSLLKQKYFFTLVAWQMEHHYEFKESISETLEQKGSTPLWADIRIICMCAAEY